MSMNVTSITQNVLRQHKEAAAVTDCRFCFCVCLNQDNLITHDKPPLWIHISQPAFQYHFSTKAALFVTSITVELPLTDSYCETLLVYYVLYYCLTFTNCFSTKGNAVSSCFHSILLTGSPCMCMGHDNSSPRIESQGHRSRSKAICCLC